MTFMDEVHRDSEQQAYKNCKELIIWLKTISPIGGMLGINTVSDLLMIAKEMEWKTVKDEHIGEIIV